MSISTRMIGREVPCSKCARQTVVPATDDVPIPGTVSTRMPIPEPLPPPPLAPTEVREAPARSPAPATVPPPSPVIARTAESALLAETTDAVPLVTPPRPPPKRAVAAEGGFGFQRARYFADDLDLTPMVDVTFLLLIFFMITASFSMQKTIHLPAPSPDQKGASQSLSLEELEDDTVFVRIDQENQITVEDEPVADRKQLAEVLSQARLSTQRNEVAIDAHPDALHESVVLAIDAANEAGMQRIRLVSRTGADE